MRKLTATNLQRAAVNRMVELGGKKKRISVSNVMREVGFSPATAKNPAKLTKSPSFIQLCDEAGLTDEFLLKALREDIEKKPKNRATELKLAFQVKGKLKEEEKPNAWNQQNNIFITDDQLSRIARRISDGNTAGKEKPD